MSKIISLSLQRRWTFSNNVQTRSFQFYSFSSIGFSNKLLAKNVSFKNYKNIKSISTGPSTVRIGCASGFWGDSPTAVGQLINHGNLDFLCLDYLSEVTMSLLTMAQSKKSDLGWCPDFAETVGPLLPQIKHQGVKVVTNAGGINSVACMEKMLSIAKKLAVDVKIAVILGDDLLPLKDTVTLNECPIPGNITSLNAYLGASPISRALDIGADIVICGRCTDSALALGPLAHKFRWTWNEWDKLAAGSLAGHLIECGAQSTGGICTDWDKVEGWDNNGFPIAICDIHGNVTITKPANTGGAVNRGTVSEQLLYEIHDPSNYILPDCVCDFSDVRVTEQLDGTVLCTRAKGKPPTSHYKVGGTYQDGWKCTTVCPIIGPRAVEKAAKTAEAILTRCRNIYKAMKLNDFSRVHMQVLGSEQAYGNNARKANLETRDACLWLAVAHDDKKALEIFSREIASAGTGMSPGLTAVIGGRPKPVPILKFFSYLYPKDKLPITIQTSDGYVEKFAHPTESKEPLKESRTKTTYATADSSPKVESYSYKLSDLAWTRSGDKGDTCNIGVIAKDKAQYPLLLEALTAEKVAN